MGAHSSALNAMSHMRRICCVRAGLRHPADNSGKDQNMVRQNLRTVIENVEHRRELKSILHNKKALYDPKRGRVVLCFETNEHRMPADFLSLREKLNGCARENVSVRVSQEPYVGALLEDNRVLEKCVKDCLVMHAPMVLPFVAPACVHLDENSIHIGVGAEEAPGIFEKLRLPEKLRRYMKESYGLDVTVKISADSEESDSAYTPPAQIEEMSQSAGEEKQTRGGAAPPPWDVNAVPAQKSAPAHVAGQRRSPVRSGADLPITRIADLEEGKRAAIDVQIVSCESRKAKNGELTIYNICATDYTNSVSAILFEREGESGAGAAPKPGTWAKLTGKYDRDSFSNALQFRISAVEPSAHVDRIDDAEEKRVELHAHTKMSAMDAVTGIKELVSLAAKWGHEAIAITDHGVTQAFPAAAAAAEDKIKLIYGCEAYMYDDVTPPYSGEDDGSFDAEYVVFDLETTGLSPLNAQITEIGAVRVRGGEICEVFQTYVAISGNVPPAVTELTGITDEMLKDAPREEDALRAFHDFCGEAVLVAHNARFDTGFLHTKGAPYGIRFTDDTVDTLILARIVYPDLQNYKLNTIASNLGISFEAHRASNDAQVTAKVLVACFEELKARGMENLKSAAGLMTPAGFFRGMKTYHVILLCRDKQGMIDLNRLVSNSHIQYLDRKKPKMPRSEIQKYRSHLIVGSACESGDLYQTILSGASDKVMHSVAAFYDYLEIQPVGNNLFLTRSGELADEEAIKDVNRRIAALGDELGIPVAATCDVHFLNPEDACFRQVLQSSMGFEKAEQPPLFFRTTREMLAEFSYLGEEKAHEVVVDVPRSIADMVSSFELLPADTAMPVIDGAAEEIEKMAYENAHAKYGDPLPEVVDARLKRELDSIIGHGFSVLYYSAHKLVTKSNSDGYLVGSRGSVGSSLTATMTGITEVNPLPPHYVCPNCRHSDFGVDVERYDCGVDLPDAVCPECGTPYRKEGFNIPFEVFLGIDADKVPDIDLNFSGEYQNRAHKYTEELFGKTQVFRAGTITGLKDKNAYGYVKHYADDIGKEINAAETVRLQKGIEGVKKTTGQHPGGMVIVPRGHEIYEYTAVQWPANEPGADFVTTHFDFRSMHDVLVKLDILGHDAPTIMRLVQDITGIDPLEIPLADPEALALFSSIDPLGIKPSDLFGISKGTLGIPEFGTSFVRQMLEDTKPKTVAEIIRICGLSHGTGVWLGNAQELIRDGTCVLSEAICARDDIMNYLAARGMDKREAFFIMENTRKGKVSKNGFSDKESALMEEVHVPEWFITACRKISYLFPKGHAVAYCLMALRIAYCKVHYKEAFYATYFDVNADKFDATFVEDGLPGIRRRYEQIQQKGNSASENEKSAATLLEICAEMYLRGLEFLRVDLEKSDPVRFVVEEDGIRLPFVAVPQLGEKVARSIAEEREKAPFISVEDLKRRTKLSASVADAMKKTGALAGLSGRDQLSLFDLN